MGTYEWQSPADKEKAERKLDDAATFLRDASNAIAIRDARIAALEATERELREAVKVLAKGGSDMAVMIDKYAAVDTDKQETVDAYIAAAAKCRQSADAVEDNPIAAEAVREAGKQ